ncbi:MAG: carbamoyltransferase HypF, partial [Acidobacteria bacterium]|nr:carbamoyltransferase HypF [Acidobacteriota bacterium]
GPQVELCDALGKPFNTHAPIADVAQHLLRGAIVAIKGLGGFHLACDATNPAAVARLRERKRRVEKPFAVMMPDVETIGRFCDVDEAARELLQRHERPIVLLPKKFPHPAADAVAPFNRCLGVFLPYTPIHFLLFAAENFRALVMTSGNLCEEPIAIENQEAFERLRGMADFFLVHNREILLRCDDSVLRVASGRARQVRRSRGFVPVPVFLKDELPPILAVGGELKNTICLTKGREAFLSQHIGDLENLETYRFFEETVERAERILEIRPELIAYDLHPAYFSTQWALKQSGVKTVGVQHHHAHIAACMAENHLDGRVIGIALDGTGYGADGAIWGGEVLLAGFRDFARAAHIEYVPMPGGEAAIREPWRMAVGYLMHHFGRDFLKLPIPFVRQLDPRKTDLLMRMIESRLNTPLTSSCGRLFDAVAALAGVRKSVNYEAQAAIELEMCMSDSAEQAQAYPLEIRRGQSGAEWEIGTRPLFEALSKDLEEGQPPGTISRRFHNAVVEVFVRLAKMIRERSGLDRVCLSGGTFQNVYLLEHLTQQLGANGFQVFSHAEVPAGDGGLSLGQALVAAHRSA